MIVTLGPNDALEVQLLTSGTAYTKSAKYFETAIVVRHEENQTVSVGETTADGEVDKKFILDMKPSPYLEDEPYSVTYYPKDRIIAQLGGNVTSSLIVARFICVDGDWTIHHIEDLTGYDIPSAMKIMNCINAAFVKFQEVQQEEESK